MAKARAKTPPKIRVEKTAEDKAQVKNPAPAIRAAGVRKDSRPKLHFVFATSAGKELEAKFAAKLIRILGQTPLDEADVIVSVGGDGLLLETLRQHHGKPVYGIKAPGSASRAFWLDKDVNSAEKLLDNLSTAHALPLMQLEAEVTFENGRKKLFHAFNEFAVERDGPQSAKMYIRATFNGCAARSPLLIGDGVVFATPMGSTGTNRTLGGSIADIRSRVVLVTLKNVYEPRGVAPGVLHVQNKFFDVELQESKKRPVRIDFDGQAVAKDEDGSRIEKIRIRIAEKEGGTLLVTKEPALRAFKTMFR